MRLMRKTDRRTTNRTDRQTDRLTNGQTVHSNHQCYTTPPPSPPPPRPSPPPPSPGRQLTGGYSVNSCFFNRMNFGFNTPMDPLNGMEEEEEEEDLGDLGDMTAGVLLDFNSLYPSSLQVCGQSCG